MARKPAAMAPSLDQPHLFLDDHWIADTGYVSRRWHRLLKRPEPVLRGDRPWDIDCPVAYGTVLRWQGAFHMWYCSWTRPPLPPSPVLYARSDDGVHWTKPSLHLHELCGTMDNNVVLRAEAPGGLIDDISVIDDPQDDKWPLKALYWDSGVRDAGPKRKHGYWAARSRDGVHWEKLGCVLPEYGDRFNAMSVRHQGLFLALIREPGMMRFGKGRVSSLITSRDLRKWSPPKLVIHCDHEDPPAMETYSATAWPGGEMLLGSIERMHMVPDVLDSELIWSRDDGQSWQRARTRPAFLERGSAGHWDSAWANLTSNGPILMSGPHGATLWFYYSGRSGAHGAVYPHNAGAIGLATLRPDGYCSIYADDRPGYVLTPPMTWPRADLLVNFDARSCLESHPRNHHGELRVEVRDPAGKTVKGYEAAASTPVQKNTLINRNCYQRITWGENRSMRRLAGRVVQLRFQLRDAHLYGFQAASKVD